MSDKLKFMKKVVKKNQVIIAALAVMIVIAGYLNLTGMDDKKISDTNKMPGVNKSDDKDKNKEDNNTKKTSSDLLDISNEDIIPPGDGDDKPVASSDASVSDEKVGDVILAENFIDGHFIGNTKLDREQVRAKNKETLETIAADTNASEESRKAATDKLVNLTNEATVEDEIETLLEAKGYETVCYYGDKGVDVVVNKESLSQNDIAKIEDVVTRKTDISATGIVITNVCVKD